MQENEEMNNVFEDVVKAYIIVTSEIMKIAQPQLQNHPQMSRIIEGVQYLEDLMNGVEKLVLEGLFDAGRRKAFGEIREWVEIMNKAIKDAN